MITTLFPWLVMCLGSYVVIQLVVAGDWWTLVIIVVLGGLVAAMLKWLFGSTD